MGKFETFDHTADIGVRVSGGTLEDLFAEAARALTDAITDLASVAAHETRQVSVSAGERDLLLRDFLGELLFRFETEGWLTRRADVTIGGAGTLRATLHGERLDSSRHGVKVLIKAVTYHELRVERVSTGWQATVVFDI